MNWIFFFTKYQMSCVNAPADDLRINLSVSSITIEASVHVSWIEDLKGTLNGGLYWYGL